jgi:hypothetical protein
MPKMPKNAEKVAKTSYYAHNFLMHKTEVAKSYMRIIT